MASFKRFRKVETGGWWIPGRGSGFLAGRGHRDDLNGFGKVEMEGYGAGRPGECTEGIGPAAKDEARAEVELLRVTGPSRFHRDV